MASAGLACGGPAARFPPRRCESCEGTGPRSRPAVLAVWLGGEFLTKLDLAITAEARRRRLQRRDAADGSRVHDTGLVGAVDRSNSRVDGAVERARC